MRSKKFPIDLYWENGVSVLGLLFLTESSSKLLVTRTGIKARTSSISGLWFPWSIYMFFEMRVDLGTLDSGERLLPFGLLVFLPCHAYVSLVTFNLQHGYIRLHHYQML